jgi:succinate dehydrogenase/fumarate reductase flavoprotein subunit
LSKFAGSADFWRTTMGKKKKIWANKAERDAWEAHVDETIARLRGLAEKAWAEIERKRAADGTA